MTSVFRERYTRLQETEAAKNELLENMLDELERLTSTLARVEGQLEQQKDISNLYHQRCKDNDRQLQSLQRIGDSNPFISVLIDGDCMNFRDELIKLAEAGGQEAAQSLKSAVIDHVHNKMPHIQRDFDVLIHVYGNLRGLTKAYCDAKILQSREDLDRFIRGFNMGLASANIIDAGNGKECSDAKVHQLFRLHIGDVHCKHLILGASSDNGYARLLGPYSGDESTRERITMLEGPPFASELVRLSGKFTTTSFPNIFRNNKIEPARLSGNIQPPPGLSSPHQHNGAHNNTLQGNSTSVSYAGLAGAPTRAAPPRKQEIPILPSSPPSREKSTPHTEGLIARNNDGYRIDLPLKPSSSVVTALKPRKMCNNHHLRGDCRNPNCQYEHGIPVEGVEREALRFLARQVPCSDDVWCEDQYCYYGHRCINGDRCKMHGCKFPEWMHGVDEKIVAYDDTH